MDQLPLASFLSLLSIPIGFMLSLAARSDEVAG
jgi:hypothetical protein